MDPDTKRILHVDDEPDTLQVVKIILEKEGFSVDSVGRGEEALKKIEANKYDLVLLDIMMPDMSGWELFTKISTIDPMYKVMFLTVLEISGEKLKELKEHGIKDYVTKPFDNDDLIKRVNQVILN